MKAIVIILTFTALTIESKYTYQKIDIEDKDYWQSVGQKDLDNVLKRKINNGVAKNVIIFIGDGMGLSTVTAARIYQGQLKDVNGESNSLVFEKFPAVGLSKTYNVDKQVADSASTATAMFSGVKTKYYMLGFDAIAPFNSCDSVRNERAKVSSMMSWAQEKGKDTGIVTTTRITHATPAATYAHINHRDWECDGEIPQQDVNCIKDIARQLVEDEPGNKFKVILGGGLKQLGDFNGTSKDDSCFRKDQKNLAQTWLNGKKNSKYVKTSEELSAVDVKKTDYLLGLFAPGHLPYISENVTTRPSLPLMTKTAIRILEKNPKGYILMVEGGRIDQAHHKNYARAALTETVEFDEAIETALSMTNSEETLIIVTADHSHAMTLNGYPARNNDILGFGKNTDKSLMQTLTYANGPGFAYHYNANPSVGNCKGNCSEVEKNSANMFKDIRNDTNRLTNAFYQHQSTFYLKDDTHGGEDVAIYASGPKSHLLVGVHEQNYIANVISYAACVGPEAHRCRHRKVSNSAKKPISGYLTLFISLVSVTFRL